jgi:GT2 family glycosyltransferase
MHPASTSASASVQPISVVIPTYQREQVLIDTLEFLLALAPPPAEILVMDQTAQHEPGTTERLQGLADRGAIRWVRLAEPSIPKAMNRGLVLAREELVLFLDDDIRPEPGLLAGHIAAHAAHGNCFVSGRLIQPWEEGVDVDLGGAFSFASERAQWIGEFMGGNISMPRHLAIALGGFDENFVRVAYRFEAELAHRLQAAGGRIFFEPAACLHHLKARSGGTRSYGEHLTTWRPAHSVGAYYYALRTGTLRQFLVRPIRSIVTRYHLRHPWRMPATLVSELGGMLWALGLFLGGPKLIPAEVRNASTHD